MAEMNIPTVNDDDGRQWLQRLLLLWVMAFHVPVRGVERCYPLLKQHGNARLLFVHSLQRGIVFEKKTSCAVSFYAVAK